MMVTDVGVGGGVEITGGKVPTCRYTYSILNNNFVKHEC